MGLHDRPYMRRGPQAYDSGGGLSGITMGLPRPTPVVKWLLIINFAVFVVQIFFDQPETVRFGPDQFAARPGPMSRWMGVTVAGFWQVWRYLTFQFLHGGVMHVALNMLGVYMLGTPLEGHFGSRRFLRFYLICGAVAGLAFVGLGAVSAMDPARPIIGASGGVFAIVLACAVLFPSFRLILLFFPVPIRLAAVIIFGGMILIVMQGFASGRAEEAMSDVAHLGGAGAAAVWMWVLPRLNLRVRLGGDRAGRGRWEKKLKRRRKEQDEIDALLDKIRRSGIDSLSWREKRKLQQASRKRQDEPS